MSFLLDPGSSRTRQSNYQKMVHHLGGPSIISTHSLADENEHGSGESFVEIKSMEERPFVEQIVIGNLRVWHVAGMIMGAVLVVIISLCCLFKCRIPRYS